MIDSKTFDWREDKKLEEEMSAKSVANYFAPLMKYLKQKNKKKRTRENIKRKIEKFLVK